MPYPTKKLGEVCDFQGGSQPPKSTFIYKEKEGYIRFLQIRDFSSDKNITYIPIAKKNRICNKNDILLGRYGASVGKVLTGKKGAYNVAIMKTFPDLEKLEKQYFYFYLKSDLFQKLLLNICSRAAQAGFSKKDIINFQIPLPPLPTQKLIVQKLDLAFKKLDKSINLTQKNLQNIEELNKSVLEEVFKKGEFEERKIEDLLEKCEYGSSEKASSNKEDGIPILRMGNIQNGGIDFNGLKYASKNSKTLPKLFLNKEDLLFNRTNSWELVGKTGIYNGEDDKYTFAGYLIRLRFDNSKVLQKYGNYFLNSQFFRKTQIEPQIDQQCGQANFSGGKLKKTTFLLPPLQKQKEIVQYLDNIFEKNKILKEKLEKNLANLQEMKQSLLKEAFENEDFVR